MVVDVSAVIAGSTVIIIIIVTRALSLWLFTLCVCVCVSGKVCVCVCVCVCMTDVRSSASLYAYLCLRVFIISAAYFPHCLLLRCQTS